MSVKQWPERAALGFHSLPACALGDWRRAAHLPPCP